MATKLAGLLPNFFAFIPINFQKYIELYFIGISSSKINSDFFSDFSSFISINDFASDNLILCGGEILSLLNQQNLSYLIQKVGSR